MTKWMKDKINDGKVSLIVGILRRISNILWVMKMKMNLTGFIFKKFKGNFVVL